MSKIGINKFSLYSEKHQYITGIMMKIILAIYFVAIAVVSIALNYLHHFNVINLIFFFLFIVCIDDIKCTEWNRQFIGC